MTVARMPSISSMEPMSPGVCTISAGTTLPMALPTGFRMEAMVVAISRSFAGNQDPASLAGALV